MSTPDKRAKHEKEFASSAFSLYLFNSETKGISSFSRMLFALEFAISTAAVPLRFPKAMFLRDVRFFQIVQHGGSRRAVKGGSHA